MKEINQPQNISQENRPKVINRRRLLQGAIAGGTVLTAAALARSVGTRTIFRAIDKLTEPYLCPPTDEDNSVESILGFDISGWESDLVVPSHNNSYIVKLGQEHGHLSMEGISSTLTSQELIRDTIIRSGRQEVFCEAETPDSVAFYEVLKTAQNELLGLPPTMENLQLVNERYEEFLGFKEVKEYINPKEALEYAFERIYSRFNGMFNSTAEDAVKTAQAHLTKIDEERKAFPSEYNPLFNLGAPLKMFMDGEIQKILPTESEELNNALSEIMNEASQLQSQWSQAIADQLSIEEITRRQQAFAQKWQEFTDKNMDRQKYAIEMVKQSGYLDHDNLALMVFGFGDDFGHAFSGEDKIGLIKLKPKYCLDTWVIQKFMGQPTN